MGFLKTAVGGGIGLVLTPTLSLVLPAPTVLALIAPLMLQIQAERPAFSFLGEVDRGIKGLRVAWSRDLGFAPVEPEVADICERAAKRFADLGCEVEEASPGFPKTWG